MAGNTPSGWTPPVQFYFRVDFQSKFDRFQASFMEITGLDMQRNGYFKPFGSGIFFKMPARVQYGKITLKRPIRNDTFRKWVYRSLKVDWNIGMIPYDMVIKLLDKKGDPIASWLCSHVYPIQWTSGGFMAEKSELAMETVVMSCNRIDFVT